MKIPFSNYADLGLLGLVLLLLLVMISTESGSIAEVISTGAGERITGHWTSYSPTRFGARTAEFFGNGTCVLSAGADETFPCKWHESESGQMRVEARASGGGTEIYLVAVAGDNMIIREPARETQFVRTYSRAAYERKSQTKG